MQGVRVIIVFVTYFPSILPTTPHFTQADWKFDYGLKCLRISWEVKN